LKKKITKNDPSQPMLTCQTHNLGHNTEITPQKVNKKIINSNSKQNLC